MAKAFHSYTQVEVELQHEMLRGRLGSRRLSAKAIPLLEDQHEVEELLQKEPCHATQELV